MSVNWHDPDYAGMAEYQGKRWVSARKQRNMERGLAWAAVIVILLPAMTWVK